VKVLVDHDIEGHALLLWGVLAAEGWLDLIDIDLVMFNDVGLPIDSSDRTVWRFAQMNEMILLTNNRNMDGADSLEQTLREENTDESLPVITIGNINRLEDRSYRNQCISRLVDIIFEIESYRGAARFFIP
jgi:hypothetical protein